MSVVLTGLTPNPTRQRLSGADGRSYVADRFGRYTISEMEDVALLIPMGCSVALKHTFDAEAAPTETDDFSEGYYIGSMWETGGSFYVCTDATTGAAVWAAVGGGGGFSGAGTNSVAIGEGAQATGSSSTALGHLAQATAEKAIAIGFSTVASGYGAIAQGYGTVASATDATAFGGYSQAAAEGATALGVTSNAQGIRSTALGAFSRAIGLQSIATGAGANDQGRDGASVRKMNGVQAGTAHLYGLTATTSPTRLTADGTAASGTNTFALPNNSIVGIKQITITGRQGNTDNVVLQLDKPEVVARGANAAATAVQSASPAVFAAVAGTVTGLTTTATIAADTTNGGINITVTPPNSETWQWRAEIEFVDNP